MKYCLNEKELKLLQDVEEITWVRYVNNDLTINAEDFTTVIADLFCEYNKKCEELEDFRQDVEDNFVRKSVSSQAGISDKDFI